MTIVYSLSFAPALMKQLCVSSGIDWDSVKEVTPEMLKDKVCYISTPEADAEKYFVKAVPPPKIDKKAVMDTEDGIPF
jgi:hypothetical protein